VQKLNQLEKLYPKRNCPVCLKKTSSLLYKNRFIAIKQTALLEGYNVVTCRSCGASFGDRLPPESRFREYYSKTSKYEYSFRDGKQHKEEVDRAESLARWLVKKIPSQTPILDIGCATGELLLKLQRFGFTNLTGLDPSRDCVVLARKKNGLNVLEGSFPAKNIRRKRYGAILLSAVLEHIPNTEEFMECLNEWLLPSGFVVIEVPDLEYFYLSKNAPFQELSTEHINFFGASSLRNLMGRFSLTSCYERHFMCPVGPGGLTGSVLTIIFKKGSSELSVVKENTSKKAMQRYLIKCDKLMINEKSKVKKLVDSQKPIFVWGVGTLTQRLLAKSNLSKAKISAFIDSNPHYIGKELAGIPIKSPKTAVFKQYPILIASHGFRSEITKTIRKVLKIKNKILKI